MGQRVASTILLLPSHRVRELLRLTNEIREIAATADDPLLHAAEGLRRLVDADVSGLVFSDGSAGSNLTRMINVGVPESTKREIDVQYLTANACGRDPAARAILRKRTTASRRRELVEDRDWYGSEFVNNYRRRCGFDDSIYGVLRQPNGTGGIGCCRAWGSKGFDEVDCELAGMFLTQNAEALFGGWKTDRLSRRERQVLGRLLRGEGAKEISKELEISVNTVNQYIQGIYRAKKVTSRAELLALALGSLTARPSS